MAKENIARSNTALTQRGSARRAAPGVGRRAAGSLPPTSAGRTVRANECSYGSVRRVLSNWHPYRDRVKC